MDTLTWHLVVCLFFTLVWKYLPLRTFWTVHTRREPCASVTINCVLRHPFSSWTIKKNTFPQFCGSNIESPILGPSQLRIPSSHMARAGAKRKRFPSNSFPSPKAALLLVSTKNYDLWLGSTSKVRDSWTSRQIWQIRLVENTKRILYASWENRVSPELSIPSQARRVMRFGDVLLSYLMRMPSN